MGRDRLLCDDVDQLAAANRRVGVDLPLNTGGFVEFPQVILCFKDQILGRLILFQRPFQRRQIAPEFQSGPWPRVWFFAGAARPSR